MKIAQIAIRNFRGFTNEAFKLSQDRPLVLTGPNGRGKSTVIHALQWCLTGDNPTDQTGKEGLLRSGAKKGDVELLLDDEASIKRHIKPHKIEVTGLDKANLGEGQLEICNLARCRARHMETALRPDLFLKLAGKDQRETLFELLRIRVTKDDIWERLEKSGLNEAYAELGGPEDQTQLGQAYSHFFALRTEHKAILKNLRAKIELDEAQRSRQVAVRPPDADQIAKQRDLQAELNQQIGELKAAQHRQRYQARLNTLREKTEGATPIGVSEWTLEGAQAQAQKLRTQLEAMAYIPTVGMTKRLEAISSTSCPTCKRQWEDLAERQAQREQVQSEIRAHERENQAYHELRSRVAIVEGRVKILFDIAETERAIEELGPVQDPAELEAKIAAQNQVVKALEDQRVAAAEWAQWAESLAKCKREAEQQAAKVASLENLVAFFGPNGAKLQIFEARCKPVVDQINATLGLWDMACRFSETMELEFSKAGDPWRSVASGSHGERTLIALALQVWLAGFTGLRIIVMDDLEALDQENFAILLDACEALMRSKEVDHIILAGVDLPCDYAHRF